MSDFGELCPLFNTGVYNELTLSTIWQSTLTDISTTTNVLDATVSGAGYGRFTFGRTVVVTGAFMKCVSVPYADTIWYLGKRTSATNTGSIIGTLTFVTTSSGGGTLGYSAFTVGTSSTFISTDILSLQLAVATSTLQGSWQPIIRYRDK